MGLTAILKKLWPLAILSLFLYAGTAFLVKTHIKPYNILSILSPEDDARQDYNNHLRTYNDENDVWLLIESKDQLDKKGILYSLHRYTTALLLRTQNLKSVVSLTNLEYPELGERFRMSSFFENGVLSEEGKERLHHGDLFRKTYLSDDGKATVIYIQLRQNLTVEQRKKVVTAIHEIGGTVSNKYGVKAHVLGTEIARMHFMDEMKRSQTIIMPIVVTIICLIIFMLYRSFKIAALCLYVIGLVYCVTVCLIIGLEENISPFSSFSLLFIFIVATADFIHFLSAYAQQSLRLDRRTRLGKAMKKVIIPCGLTSLTTLAGFMALMICDLPPVRLFGVYCAFGVIACYILTFTLLPWLINLFKIDLRKSNTHFTLIPEFLFQAVRNHRILIVVSSILILVFSLSSIRNLRFDDSLYNKFVPDHPLSSAVGAFHDHFQFLGSIDLILKGDRDKWRSRNGEELVHGVHRDLESLEDTATVRSMSDYMRFIRKSYKETSESFLTHYHLAGDFHFFDSFGVFDSVLPPGKQETRVILFPKTLESTTLLKIFDQTHQILQNRGLKDGRDYSLNGFSQIRAEIFASIFRNFTRSFFLGFFLILMIFVMLFRSIKWGLLAMLPNLLPLAVIGGIMGYAGMTAEYNLVLLVSIVMGIAVDDTIHFLFAVKKNREISSNTLTAIRHALHQTSPALIGTTLIFILTIPAFFLTHILMFHQVATVLVITLILALLCDLLLLPTLLVMKENLPKLSGKRFGQGKVHETNL